MSKIKGLKGLINKYDIKQKKFYKNNKFTSNYNNEYNKGLLKYKKRYYKIIHKKSAYPNTKIQIRSKSKSKRIIHLTLLTGYSLTLRTYDYYSKYLNGGFSQFFMIDKLKRSYKNIKQEIKFYETIPSLSEKQDKLNKIKCLSTKTRRKLKWLFKKYGAGDDLIKACGNIDDYKDLEYKKELKKNYEKLKKSYSKHKIKNASMKLKGGDAGIDKNNIDNTITKLSDDNKTILLSFNINKWQHKDINACQVSSNT